MAVVAEPIGIEVADTNGREPERWRACGVDEGARLRSWSEILAATHLRFDVRASSRTPTRFEGAVARRTVGDLMLVDCASSPFHGRRGPDLIDPRSDGGPEDVLGFQFVSRGVELVREGARELALRAGDVVLWDGLEPTEIEIHEAFCKRTLLFPRSRVLAVCPRLGERGALPPLAGSPSARLLVRYMHALAQELPRMDEAATVAAANAALELLRAAVEPALPSDRAATRGALRAEIGRYIRGHLQDPSLGPASIAAAYAISVRTLHALFEDAEVSVSALIRGERLARCLEDLRRPEGGSVTEIAFRWGFSDAAHFSRVFKREFGLTPSQVRHTAVAGAAPTSPVRST